MAKKYERSAPSSSGFNLLHVNLLNKEQEMAHDLYKKNDILFLIGAAGCGKTHVAIAFAIQDLMRKEKEKIVLSRPVVEAGESLGFLPGDLNEKIYPYMIPLYDCLSKICKSEDQKKLIESKCEAAPLAYLRGKTFSDSICILDEAQNCTAAQIKLFLTRLGKNSKMIITGDPSQTDLFGQKSGLMEVVKKLTDVDGIAVQHFSEESIVRHPLVAQIVKRI